MSTPVVVDIVTYFYPIGNTPAVHLTRGLPYKQSANILLLGCGDVRNILFTVYSDQRSGRKLDVTCCDIEPAVIARNILLLTLLLDDVDGSNDASIWDIYYHLCLDTKALELLGTQATKLHELAASMQGWHRGQYGRQFRFCDEGTLAKVRDIWDTYRFTRLNQDDRERFLERSKAAMQRAMESRAYHLGGTSFVISGLRSAAPVGIGAIHDAPKLHQHYWDHGNTDREGKDPCRTDTPNPMFVTDRSTLHYGTDPLLGFHLATAYTPLTEQSPFHAEVMTHDSSCFRVVEAARLQFRSWARSLRQYPPSCLTIRFFAGDAISFLYALQQKKITRSERAAGMYRDPYHAEPLVLDGEEYTDSARAPLTFDVIDTSNLLDHVGALNLLVAAAPMLDEGRSASLYTESLVKQEETHTAYIDSLLKGHFPTISTLLGLFPVEYWTNASASSAMDDLMMDSSFIGVAGDIRSGQMHVRLTWKQISPERTSPSPSAAGKGRRLRVDESGCARILHDVYLHMFQHENMQRLFSDLNVHTISKSSLVRYHRGSYALFLRFVRSRIAADWGKVMDHLLRLIETDSSLLMGMNYIQELYLFLHIFEVYSVDTFSGPIKQPSTAVTKGLERWNGIPPVIYVTLKVPRERLRAITSLEPAEIGTPIVHCVIQSSPASRSGRWQNIFSAVQLSFGDISTTGERHSDAFSLHIVDDGLKWNGSSALFVSFRAPTWTLLIEPRTASIAFGIQSTPQSSRTFAKRLGIEMNIYETNLGDEENVFMTKDPPNQPESASLCTLPNDDSEDSPPQGQVARTVISANVDSNAPRIAGLTGRLELLTEDVKAAMKSGSKVESVQVSPCTVIATVGLMASPIVLEFPSPVLARSKIRIARKSSYIEIEAPLANAADWKCFPSFIHPIYPTLGPPVVWNTPYTNLECLPTINTSRKQGIQWLVTHSSCMFSSKERELRDTPMLVDQDKDVRVRYKDSLFSLIMHFSGLQGEQAQLFGLNDPTGGGIHVLIFVASLKLDVANQTVVLDSAILPLTKSLMPRLRSFLEALSAIRLCSIKVDAVELKLWRQVLPAMVERCRTWEHRPDCEYLAESRIPLSLENGQPLLCSCGSGQLPKTFLTGVPHWGSVSKYFVRAALSPCFPAPFCEKLFDFSKINKANPFPHNGGGCRAWSGLVNVYAMPRREVLLEGMSTDRLEEPQA
ncbi:hypothetical protein Z517_11620 [Fonsecaea pedrosoi CBS 271.37]|uniref:DUF4470 domain-containing protein n=1 Tax=Fonsecaea pedrosoi CBS 271.37 TaxID=1442368 RepID=A0A0D2G7X3_9EURO|nr:uncharacterized protein Z517_11620 [Fonsecaea pedrosoi CBS 271.37]KIW74850.1 hypothetical protein Z517_11620 [Fonsecaea pedrosoi CBS 271.37]